MFGRSINLGHSLVMTDTLALITAEVVEGEHYQLMCKSGCRIYCTYKKRSENCPKSTVSSDINFGIKTVQISHPKIVYPERPRRLLKVVI